MNELIDKIAPTHLRMLGIAAFLLFSAGLGAWHLLTRYAARHPVSPAALDRRMADRAWNARILAAAFCGFLLLQWGVAILVRPVSATGRAVLGLFLFGAALIFAMQLGKRTAQPPIFAGRKRLLLWAPAFHLALIPLLATINLIWNVLITGAGNEAAPQPLIGEILHAPLAAKVIYTVVALIAAPVCEEFFFRGLLYPRLLIHYGAKPAAGIVGLLFGALHFNLSALAALSFFGTASCLLYRRTGSLWAPIGLHMVFNASTLAFLFAVAALAN